MTVRVALEPKGCDFVDNSLLLVVIEALSQRVVHCVCVWATGTRPPAVARLSPCRFALGLPTVARGCRTREYVIFKLMEVLVVPRVQVCGGRAPFLPAVAEGGSTRYLSDCGGGCEPLAASGAGIGGDGRFGARAFDQVGGAAGS